MLVIGGALLSQFVFLNSCPEWLRFVVREIAAVCRDSSTQCIVNLCLASNIMISLVLEHRSFPQDNWWRFGNPNLWLAGLVTLVVSRNILTHDGASHSTKVAIFLTGIVFGKAICVWIRWRADKIEPRAIWLVYFLVGILVGEVFWPAETREFQYHGITRWSGVLENPNLYGLLMGTGVILAAGQIFGVLSWKIEDGKSVMGVRGWKLGIRQYVVMILCFCAAICCSFGLRKSYSRGAWLGTICGLAFLVGSWVSHPISADGNRTLLWIRNNMRSLVVIVVATGILAFWQFRFTEWCPAQRIFSAFNVNDFSWRNRVAAWEGAIHMVVDRPFSGFGWGKAETVYQKQYCSLEDSAVIQLNDYLMIGISAGVPTLLCFVGFLTLSFRKKSTEINSSPSTFKLPSSIFTTCRAGAIVLLIGFWFDGGLFKLSVAPVFWILTEVSRLELFAPSQSIKLRTGAERQPSATVAESVFGIHNVWLRRLALVLVVTAFLQTAVYLGTPFLVVNDETLAVARNCLISPKEIDDFNFLSTNSIWCGKKLNNILVNVDLANYNRQLVNWKLDNQLYREYVLTPMIQQGRDGKLNWRRELWENIYPHIRKENNPSNAAQIVEQQLRSSLAMVEKGPLTIEEMWQRHTADAKGFEAIFVASLRSVGVPARLGKDGRAEYFNGEEWRSSPSVDF